MEPKPSATLLVDFSKPDEAPNWKAVDDGVMGGQSKSQLMPSGQGSVYFRGLLSLEQGGGFASVARERLRAPLPAQLHGLRLRVRGDGKRYQLRLRMSAHPWSGSYLASFDTQAGQWQELELTSLDFTPRLRGRAQPQAPALQWSAVDGLGLLIADKQVGEFSLELAWIAWR